MSIATGPKIRDEHRDGVIIIEPCHPDQIAEASVDLHLFPEVAIYKGTYQPTGDPAMPARALPWDRMPSAEIKSRALDVAKPREVDRFAIPESGLVLVPGVFYLGAVIERLCAPTYRIEATGKSSEARLSIKVHFTAGHVEPGFDGQITLEIEGAVPVIVRPGWPIAQAVFHDLIGPVESYANKGHYTGQHASGPVASRSHLHKRRHVGGAS